MLPWPSQVPKVLHVIISAYFFFFRFLLFSFSFCYQHGASTKVNSWRWTGNWEFTEKDSSWRNRWNIDWKTPRPSIASLNPVAYTEFRCNGKLQNIATLFRAYDVRLFSGRKTTRIMQMEVLSELSLLRQSALKATTIVHYPYLRSLMVQIRFRACSNLLLDVTYKNNYSTRDIFTLSFVTSTHGKRIVNKPPDVSAEKYSLDTLRHHFTALSIGIEIGKDPISQKRKTSEIRSLFKRQEAASLRRELRYLDFFFKMNDWRLQQREARRETEVLGELIPSPSTSREKGFEAKANGSAF